MFRRKGFTLIELLIVVAIIAILAAIAVPNFLEAQTRAKVSRCKADMRTQAVAMEAYYVDYNTYTRDSDSSLDWKDLAWSFPDGVAPDPVDEDDFEAGNYTEFDGKICAWNIGHPQWSKCANGAMQLTTPVAYMSTLLSDPFHQGVAVEGASAVGYRIASGTWSYEGSETEDPINPADHQDSHLVFNKVGPRACYAIIGVGPDGSRARMAYKNFPFMSLYEEDEGAVSTEPCTDHLPQPGCWMDYDPTNGTVSIGDIYHFGGNYLQGRYMRNGKIIGSNEDHAGVEGAEDIIW